MQSSSVKRRSLLAAAFLVPTFTTVSSAVPLIDKPITEVHHPNKNFELLRSGLAPPDLRREVVPKQAPNNLVLPGLSKDNGSKPPYTPLDSQGHIIGSTNGLPIATPTCVRDNATRLVWEARTVDNMTWSDAAQEAVAANAAQLCGHADWRVPSVTELRNLANANARNPDLNSDMLFGAHTDLVWSNTLDTANPNLAWTVNMGQGVTQTKPIMDTASVRLVRGKMRLSFRNAAIRNAAATFAPSDCTVSTINVGSTVNGTLSNSDCYDDFWEAYNDIYSFSATAGKTYTIILSSAEFDTWLDLFNSDNENLLLGDGPDEGVTKIVYTATTSETLYIDVTSLFSGDTGAYTLSLTEGDVGPSCPPTATSIVVNSPANGNLTATDCQLSDGTYYDYYSFAATAGTTYTITLNSTAFDAYLGLLNSSAVLDEDDNGNGGTNAKIVYTATASGTLYVVANAYDVGETGSYTLLVNGGEDPPCPPTPTVISVNSTANGDLTVSDCQLDDETYYDFYSFAATAGTSYTITLNSTAFDAFLFLLSDDVISDDVVLDSDDDSNGGSNAKIVYTATASGTLYIIANSFWPDDMGAYTLTLTGGVNPPTAVTKPASNATKTSATLNGTVNANGAATTVSFDFGTSTAYGTSVAATPGSVTGNSNTAVSANKTGLTCNTTYHYRVKAVNSAGTTNGTDASFTTLACPPPTAVTNPATASSITKTSATLNGTVNANGPTTTVSFDFGLTTAYGLPSVAATPGSVTGNSNTAVSANKTGLTCGKTYHYRVKAVNSAGTSYGADASFTTLACIGPPIVVTNAANSITATSAILNGTVNANGANATVTFQIGYATAYGLPGIAATPGTVTGTSNTAVSANKTGLTCGKTYHYRIKAVNSVGTVYGVDKTFSTLACAVRQADFVITALALSPATPAANGTFGVVITVKNQGLRSGDGGFLDVWTNQAAAATCASEGDKWAEVGILAAGASKNFVVNGLPSGAAGAKTMRAYVDSFCEVVESNETNNQLTKSYTVQ